MVMALKTLTIHLKPPLTGMHMTRPIFQKCVRILAVCVCLIPYPAHAELDKKWQEWSTYYYFHKSTDDVPAFLHALDDKSALNLSEDPGAANPIAGLLSQIFVTHPDHVPLWLEDEYSDDMRAIIASALIFADLQDFIPVEQIKLASQRMVPLKDLNPTLPTDQDALWGAFLGSGNPLFVHKIISMLDESKSLSGDRRYDKVTRAAAIWSLTSNMHQHALVEQIIRKAHEEAIAPIKGTLQTIISAFDDRSQKQQPLLVQDGAFKARLELVSHNLIQELQKPAHEALRLNTIEIMHPGETATPHIGFTGIAVNQALQTNVSYDFIIYDPNGEIYARNLNLIAHKGRIANRFNVFTAIEFPMLEFTAHDPLGTYKLEVLLTDHIAGKTLQLSDTVILEERAPSSNK